MSDTLVSVIIPSFNAEKYIRKTLQSVQCQTHRNIQVLIIDDCSTDSTDLIVREFTDSDSRFNLIKLKSNSNRPAIPRNVGISMSRGKFIAFLDHDDIWFKNKLERQLKILENRLDLGMVHSHLWDFTERSKFRGLFFLSNPYRRIASYQLLRQHNVVQCSSTLIRTDILKELNGFDERLELRAIEDYHLWLRLSKSHKIFYISEIHGLYRNSTNSTSTQISLDIKHTYLDMNEGTNIMGSKPPIFVRILRKIFTFPLAIYFHIIDGLIRQLINTHPRVFEPKS